MADESEETRFCNNCKRDIAAVNFVIHEVHCHRNIVLCQHCEEPVPKSELDEHIEEYHVPVPCDLCQTSVKKEDLEHHKENDCPKRTLHCAFCELSMPQCELKAHMDYCGTRTEMCPKCKQYIMLKDLVRHEETGCASAVAKPNHSVRNGRGGGTGTKRTHARSVRDSSGHVNNFAMDELSRILNDPSMQGTNPYSQSMPSQNPNNMRSLRSTSTTDNPRLVNSTYNDIHERTEMSASSKSRETLHRRDSKNADQARRDGLRGQARNGLSRHYGHNLDRDHLLAMQLDQDLNDGNFDPDFTSEDSSTVQLPAEDVLPCEFCDELFPYDDIIQHQVICNGRDTESQSPNLIGERDSAPALPNNSPRRNTIPTSDRPQPQIVDNLSYLAAHDRVANVDEDSLHLNPGLDDEVMLPCEFCGTLLPDYIIIQHQAICDSQGLPPVTPPPGSSSRTSPSHSSRSGHRGARSRGRSNVSNFSRRGQSNRPTADSRSAFQSNFSSCPLPEAASRPVVPRPPMDRRGHNKDNFVSSSRSGVDIGGTRRTKKVPNQWRESSDGTRGYNHNHVVNSVRAREGDRQFVGDFAPSTRQPYGADAGGFRESFMDEPQSRTGQYSHSRHTHHGDNRKSYVTNQKRRTTNPRLVSPQSADVDFSEEGFNMRVSQEPSQGRGRQVQRNSRNVTASRSKKPQNKRKYPQGSV